MAKEDLREETAASASAGPPVSARGSAGRPHWGSLAWLGVGAGVLIALGAATFVAAGDTPWPSTHPMGAEVAKGPDGVIFYSPREMLVNIQTDDGRPAFMKVKLAFEVRDPGAVRALDAQSPRLADVLQTFLRELRPSDLAGAGGTLALRSELQRRVNLVVLPAHVDGVLIQQLLVSQPASE